MPADPLALQLDLQAAGSADPLALELTFGAEVGPGGTQHGATVTAALTLVASMSAASDSGIPASFRASCAAAWAGATVGSPGLGAGWGSGDTPRAQVGLPSADTEPRSRSVFLGWGAALGTDRAARAPWRASSQASGAVRALWSGADRRSVSLQAPWNGALRFSPTRAVLWASGRPLGAAVRVLAGSSRRTSAPRALRWGGFRLGAASNLPWSEAYRAATYGSPWTPVWITPPAPEVVTLDLHFCRSFPANPLALLLALGVDPCTGLPPGASATIPIRRTYMSTHSILARRRPDLLPLTIYGGSLAQDDGSFCWTFSLRGPASLQSALSPSGGVPVEIELEIDGIQWVFAVEQVQRTQEFGRDSVTVSGRSSTALVAEPYFLAQTYANTSVTTAQAIVADALNLTGVSSDWQATDWVVPAGAFSLVGTPLAVASRVAEAAGAMLLSHRSNPQLIITPRYPTLPWEWGAATVDVALPLTAVTVLASTRQDRPDWNGVYVSGEAQGVLAHVQITGSGGATLAPLIVDPLATEEPAARQRGRSVLGGAGPQTRETLTLPVLTGPGEPGVLEVGQLVEVSGVSVTPWRGLVRAVSVSFAWPQVRQTIIVERHA